VPEGESRDGARILCHVFDERPPLLDEKGVQSRQEHGKGNREGSVDELSIAVELKGC